MKSDRQFQRKQLEALQSFYHKVKRSSETEPTMRDVVLTWFTEGYAERFRSEYLKNNSIVS